MKTLEDIVATARGVLTCAEFFLLIIAFIPITVLYKYIHPDRPYDIPKLFHGLLLKAIGIHVIVKGEPLTNASVLFVSNHVSYLDIPVLGSLLPAGFVAKAEVAEWPLFGFLSRLQNTIFIERRSTRAVDQRTQLQDYFAKGRNVILFPEGTSSEGLSVLPFKSSLFSIVEATANGRPITVQPISVTCIELDGFPLLREDRALYAWYGDMTLIPHLWNVFKNGDFTVEVIFRAPLTSVDFPNRKDLAAACQAVVGDGIAQSLSRVEGSMKIASN